MEMEPTTSMEELRKSLECPVCLETPKSRPVYQCKNGHILCSGCSGKVKKCPECRVDLNLGDLNLKDVRIRCLFAEKQLEK